MSKKLKTNNMESYYASGNFYMARKEAKNILSSLESDSLQKKRALEILSMTGIDKFVVLAGVLSFLLIVTVAFIFRYKG